MAWQVIFSARSRIDLQKIVEYIARDNSAAAERFASLLITQAESLANTPEMGPVGATLAFGRGGTLVLGVLRPDNGGWQMAVRCG